MPEIQDQSQILQDVDLKYDQLTAERFDTDLCRPSSSVVNPLLDAASVQNNKI